MENPTLPPEGCAKLRERHRQERDAIDAFVISAQTGDAARFEKSFELMDLSGTWRRAFRALTLSRQVDDSIKPVFTEAWLQFGDRMSDQVGDNLVFVSALRLFLPTYDGPILTLLRGDSFWTWEAGATAHHGLRTGTSPRAMPCRLGGLDWEEAWFFRLALHPRQSFSRQHRVTAMSRGILWIVTCCMKSRWSNASQKPL